MITSLNIEQLKEANKKGFDINEVILSSMNLGMELYKHIESITNKSPIPFLSIRKKLAEKAIKRNEDRKLDLFVTSCAISNAKKVA